MPSAEKPKNSMEALVTELAGINRDIADYYMGEGEAAHMSKQDVKELEDRRERLEQQLKATKDVN